MGVGTIFFVDSIGKVGIIDDNFEKIYLGTFYNIFLCRL